MSTPTEAEEKYFAKQEAERRAQMRQTMTLAAHKTAAHQAVAERLAAPIAVAERIANMGFDEDTARIFDLIPLVHVAWADGSVSRAERAQIMHVLDARGIEAGSHAAVLLASLLEEKPSDAFMDQTLDIIRQIVSENGKGSGELLDLCAAIAGASGGILGFGNKVSDEEKAAMAHIAEKLSPAARADYAAKL